MPCLPALLYLLFGLGSIVWDLHYGLVNSAILRVFVVFMYTFLLDMLCEYDLSIISWILVAFPFLFTGITVSIILFHLGLDVASGGNNQNQQAGKNLKPQRTYLNTSKYYDTYFS